MKISTLKKSIKINWWQTAALGIAIAVIICLVQLAEQGGSFGEALGVYIAQPRLFVLNGFPVVCLLAAAWLILGNIFGAGFFTALVFWTLSYANLLKIEGREDPLIPSDLTLLREAWGAATDYALDMHWGMVALLISGLLVFLFLSFVFQGPKLNWKLRVAGVLVIALGFTAAFKVVYRRASLYNSFEVEEKYNIASVFDTLGLNYCFLYNFDLYPIDEPEGFSKAEIEALEYSSANVSGSTQPNIIIVMCEAFTDMADEDCFLYDEETSPLRDYYLACSGSNTLNGHIVVTNYGAGTANTEFNVLTGMQTSMISENASSAFRTVHNKTKNIGSVLADQGYTTWFMHPGESWFYNRNSVYKYFGISDQTFKEAFDETDYKGTMISDEAFLDELKAQIEAHDSPMFAYTVTIQNHQAYWYGKYDGYEMDTAPVDRELTPASQENLDVYMEGIKDSSAMLLELCSYVDGLEEPTILLFFGDHRPNVGNAALELELYQDVQDPWTYSTPFMIKANYELDYDALELPKDCTVSDSYLSSMLLELAGYEGADAYFDFMMQQRRAVPVIMNADYDFSLMRKWTYYRLKY